MTAPTRPVLRYHGGKWRLAPWLISFFPPHRVYVEPFGGAASVLMRKPRAYAEVYNDLDGEVVNVFRVLRQPIAAQRLEEALRLTPFARAEFEAAYEPAPGDPVEQARRSIVKTFMGFGSGSIMDPRPAGMRTTPATWRPPTAFRADSNKSGTTPAHDWRAFPDALPAMVERFRGVVVEQRPALEVLLTHDRRSALHYVDPPYVHDTRKALKRGRGRNHLYRHEMTDKQHADLAAVLHELEGMVVLSGYPCDLYDVELYPEWQRHEKAHLADGARKRTEVVWLNPACVRALSQARQQGELMEVTA